MRPALVVHGGCGTPPAGEENDRMAAASRAADVGWRVLQSGGSAVDAAEATVRHLEDEPLLNAGTGSYLQADGVSRMDASIMSGDGRAGAVAQVPGVRNPVRLARYLLDQDAHVMLAGPSALHLAVQLGHEMAVVATPAKIKYWQDHLTGPSRSLDYAKMAEEWKRENPRPGTVGCVALDRDGRLAAATSTGGTGQCYPGRVGDSPIIGAGTYCTAKVGVSMTGVGERIMVLLSAKRLCDLVRDGAALEEAAKKVLEEIERTANESAGLIALDANGVIVAMKDTKFLAWATRT
jgi:beta-aspartyl-peptidase (threonine type)